MKKKRIFGMMLAGLFLAAGLAACNLAGPATAPPEQPQATPQSGLPNYPPPPAVPVARGLNIATLSEPPSVAPARHTAAAGGLMNALTHNGLFRVDYASLEPVPDLISGWTAVSDTVFEFNLRQGILFHNGEEMTAEDVVASLYFVREFPEARAYHGSMASAEVVDTYTFRIDTGEPNAMLFFDLTHQGNSIMPKSLIDSGHDFQTNPVGSGPFIFEDWALGTSLTFVRNDNYFDTDRAAHVEYAHWVIIPEGTTRTIALETGDVDFIVEVPFPDIPRLEAHPDINVYVGPSTAHNFLLLNNDLPMFESVHVRRAIDMALDKESMVIAASDGYAIPTWANMPEMFAGASLEGTRSFDPAAARALLAEHNIDPSTITFDILTSNEEGVRRGAVAQSNLRDIGIEVTISMIDLAGWLSVTASPDYEAAWGSFTGANLLTFFRNTTHIASINGPNRSRMRNEELTALIDQAIATVDTDARIAILEQASRMSNEHIGFVPTHLSMVVRAHNANLVAPENAATGHLNLNRVYWLR
jgi:peptide/nickel transport system substrate-binding protein